MRTTRLLSAIAVTAFGGCGVGAGPPTTDEIASCLSDRRASVERNPQVSDNPESPNFVPVFTPDTKLVARGKLAPSTRFMLFTSTNDSADYAESRAHEYLQLFGVSRDHALRSGDAMLLVVGGSDEKLAAARDCVQ